MPSPSASRVIAAGLILLVGVIGVGCSSSSNPVTPTPSLGSPIPSTGTGTTTLPTVTRGTDTPSLSVRLSKEGSALQFSVDGAQRTFGEPGLCDMLGDPDEEVQSCGIVPQPGGTRGGAFVVGLLDSGQTAHVSYYRYVGRQDDWAENRRVEFPRDQFESVDAVVFATADDSHHLLVTYKRDDKSVDFDIVESLGAISAHEQVLAVAVAGHNLQVWRKPNEREDYVFVPGAATEADPRWERIAVVAAPLPN